MLSLLLFVGMLSATDPDVQGFLFVAFVLSFFTGGDYESAGRRR